jgi:hypothetical protein
MMRNIGRRLINLERLPQFTRPLSPIQQIQRMALQAMSDEHLESLNRISVRPTSGVETSPTKAETATEAAYIAALDLEAGNTTRSKGQLPARWFLIS